MPETQEHLDFVSARDVQRSDPKPCITGEDSPSLGIVPGSRATLPLSDYGRVADNPPRIVRCWLHSSVCRAVDPDHGYAVRVRCY
jgi:hypothetical protein